MVLSSQSPQDHRKPCTICHTPKDVLIRCQTSSSPDDTTWQFVCPGKCWNSVSGGVVDGDAAHPGYRYGGMWKNKHALVSAKMPKKRKGKAREVKTWREGVKWVVNDRAAYEGGVWVCRKSHVARVGEEPGAKKGVGFWKEDDGVGERAEVGESGSVVSEGDEDEGGDVGSGIDVAAVEGGMNGGHELAFFIVEWGQVTKI